MHDHGIEKKFISIKSANKVGSIPEFLVTTVNKVVCTS